MLQPSVKEHSAQMDDVVCCNMMLLLCRPRKSTFEESWDRCRCLLWHAGFVTVTGGGVLLTSLTEVQRRMVLLVS